MKIYNTFFKYFFEQVRDEVYKKLICAPTLMIKTRKDQYINLYPFQK